MILLMLSVALLIGSLVLAVIVDNPGTFLFGIMGSIMMIMISAILALIGVNQTVTTETVNIIPLNGNYVTLSDDNYFVQTDKSIVSIPVSEAKIMNGTPRIEYKTSKGEGTWTFLDSGTETTIYTNTGVAVASGS